MRAIDLIAPIPCQIELREGEGKKLFDSIPRFVFTLSSSIEGRGQCMMIVALGEFM